MTKFIYSSLLVLFATLSMNAQNGRFIDGGEILRLESTGTNGWMSFYHGTDYKGYLWAFNDRMELTATDGPLYFGTSFSTRAVIDAAGNFGVGTTAPAYKTDVVGDRIRLRNSTAGTARTIMLRTDGAAVDLQAENSDLFLRAVNNDININPFVNDGNVWVGGQSHSSAVTTEEFNVVNSDMTLEDTSPFIRMASTSNTNSGLNFWSNTASEYWMVYNSGTNSFFFNNSASATNADFAIDATSGDVTISNDLNAGGDIDVAGAVTFGSVESLSDGGANTIESNSSIRPEIDLVRDLGTSTLAWDWVYYDDLSNQSFAPGSNEEVKSLNKGLKAIMEATPVSYKSLNDPTNQVKTGFDPEQLINIIPEAVTTKQKVFDDEGNPTFVEAKRKGINYDAMIPVLTKAIQEQQELIKALEARISELEQN